MLVSPTRTPHRSSPATDHPLPWQWSESRGARRLTVPAELDLATVCLLDREVRDAQEGGRTVILDALALEHVDSIGLELMLVAARRAARTGGRLVVVCGAGLAWYLELIGLDRRLELHRQPAQPRAVAEGFPPVIA